MILGYFDNKPLKQSKLTGKMEHIPSLSTSPMNNDNCRKNAKIKGSICASCYSVKSCKVYKNLGPVLQCNGEILENDIDVTNIKTGAKYYRFESHGDIRNKAHLHNLVKIAGNNPQTKFALWTKHYKIAENYFNGHKKPDNLQLQYSALMVNGALTIDKFQHCDRIFTVWDKGMLPDSEINCGARDCFTCGLCYNKNDVQYINEIKK